MNKELKALLKKGWVTNEIGSDYNIVWKPDFLRKGETVFAVEEPGKRFYVDKERFNKLMSFLDIFLMSHITGNSIKHIQKMDMHEQLMVAYQTYGYGDTFGILEEMGVVEKRKTKVLSHYKYREAVTAAAKYIKYSYPNDLVLDEVQEIMVEMTKEIFKELYG